MVAIFVAGLAVGATFARPALAIYQMIRYGRHRNADAVMIWAYRHLPEIMGEGARTLDITLTPQTRDEDIGQIRVIYDTGKPN